MSDVGGSLLHPFVFFCFFLNVQWWCLHAISLSIQSQISAAWGRYLLFLRAAQIRNLVGITREAKMVLLALRIIALKKPHYGSYFWIVGATSTWWIEKLPWPGRSIRGPKCCPFVWNTSAKVFHIQYILALRAIVAWKHYFCMGNNLKSICSWFNCSRSRSPKLA